MALLFVITVVALLAIAMPSNDLTMILVDRVLACALAIIRCKSGRKWGYEDDSHSIL